MLFDYYVVAVLDDEGVFLLACIYIVGALLNLVVAVCDAVEAAEVEDAGVECAECVTLYHYIFVVAALLLFLYTAVVCNVSVAPCLATIETVIEHVVANLYITYT